MSKNSFIHPPIFPVIKRIIFFNKNILTTYNLIISLLIRYSLKEYDEH